MEVLLKLESEREVDEGPSGGGQLHRRRQATLDWRNIALRGAAHSLWLRSETLVAKEEAIAAALGVAIAELDHRP